jgi:hypothetical protein
MEMQTKIPEFVTIPQASELAIGLTPHFVRQLCKKRKIDFLMSGTIYLIRKDSFLKYIGEVQNGLG